MHEEHFLSSSLREDVESTEEIRKDMDEKAREGENRSGKIEVEREEEKTVAKKCESVFPKATLRIFCSVEVSGDLVFPCGDSCGGSGGSSVCGSAGSSGVSGVLEVLVSPWLVGDLGADAFFSDCEFVLPQFFSFSTKRRAFHLKSQGDVSVAGSSEVPPSSRRRTQEVPQEGC